jgi:hypothetical protein
MKTLIKKGKKREAGISKKAMCCAKLSTKAVGCHD